MRLFQIKRNYDTVLSLGGGCAVAYHLDRNKLRFFAGPLDWKFTPTLSLVNQLISNGFLDFMEFRNLEVQGLSAAAAYADSDYPDTTPTFSVKDLIYDCISPHEFPYIPGIPFLELYNQFKAKLNRRVERLYDKIKGSESILFIRSTPQGVPTMVGPSLHEKMELVNILSGISMRDYSILFIEDSLPKNAIIMEEELGMERVCSIKIPKADVALGDDIMWDYILSGITISNNSI